MSLISNLGTMQCRKEAHKFTSALLQNKSVMPHSVKALYACNSCKACSHHLKHIAHERLGVGASRCVDDECNHGWKARRKSLCDDGPRSRPSKNLNLAGSVNNDIFQGWVTWLLAKADHLCSSLSHVNLTKNEQNCLLWFYGTERD